MMRGPVLFCLIAVAARAGSLRLDRHRWADAFELRSRHYVIETNTFPEVARALADRLEEAYFLYQDRFGALRGRAAERMRVLLFKNTREYLESGDGVKGAIGHFDAALDRCALAWRGDEGATGWPIAIHEGCHHYFRRRFPDASPPSWYAEGVACYFEGLQDDTVTNGVARLRLQAARLAHAGGDADLELLLSTRARVVRGALRLDNFGPMRYYALSWSLVHFLATDARYRRAFRRFELRLFHSRPPTAEREAHARNLLEEECGPLETVERHWHAYLESLRSPESPPTPPVYSWELSSNSAWVRYAALARIRKTRLPADLVLGVRRCLRDPDLLVRTAASLVVAGKVDAEAAKALASSLDLGDADLKRAALKALGDPEARSVVPRLLEETEERAAALEALAQTGDPRAFAALRTAVLERDLPARTRARCASALGADEGAEPYLKVAADDPAANVRNAARASLARLGYYQRARPGPMEVELANRAARYPRNISRKVDDLIRQLRDPGASHAVKVRACTLLALSRSERAVPALRRLCGPQHADALRLEAVRALVHITGETRGFEPGQSARAREAALRNWADG